MLKVRRLSAWQTVTTLRIRHLGEWRRIRRLRVYRGGAWRDIGNFLQPLTAGVTVSDGYLLADGPAVVTGSASVTPGGGLAPYSYAWTLLSWSGAGTLSLSGASTATASVSTSYGRGSHIGTAGLQCVVTDSLGASVTLTPSVALEKESPA